MAGLKILAPKRIAKILVLGLTWPPLLVQALSELVGVVMLQLLVELPPGAYAPGGPSAA